MISAYGVSTIGLESRYSFTESQDT
jgi:hypothetical protein